MTKIIDLDSVQAKNHFLKGGSYFNGDFPNYIGFEEILKNVSMILSDGYFLSHKSSNPEHLSDVNYSFVANKDGRFAWRPYELMHPVIYVSLVNLICSNENWHLIVSQFKAFEKGIVSCCSSPVISDDHQKDQAAQVGVWWQEVEQRSLSFSLEFSHVLHTDVTDCYGALYTHSIAWALHGLEAAKESRGKENLLGDLIDKHIRAGRFGQTNGISQGSVLMDFVAEIVLGYVDTLITTGLVGEKNFRILRYRDDYRIFANSDIKAEEILKVISDSLRTVGMRLSVTKTFINTNVIEGSIKQDKLAGIDLQDLGKTNAQTLQKQLLRLYSFGRKYPNSGALKRLLSEIHKNVLFLTERPRDLDVQVAIVTDIAVVSPQTFPVVAGILSKMISLEDKNKKYKLWDRVYAKISKIPYNGYQEIWLQRVTKPKSIGINYESEEKICRIVNGENINIWNSDWVSNKRLKDAVEGRKIVVRSAEKSSEVIATEEIKLFKNNAYEY